MDNHIFVDDITKQIKQKKTHICVGLDSDYEKIPSFLKKSTSIQDAILTFNKDLIDATYDITAVYKLNVSFYAGYGIEGLQALQKTNQYIRSKDATIKIIADCKRSEMARSAQLVAKEIFDEFSFDGLVVTPWFGEDTLAPYRTYPGKAVFVLCHDSNPSAGEVQDAELKDGRKLYELVTELVVKKWNTTGNILVEGPLTYPDILRQIIKIAGNDQFYLAAGLGAQGGNIDDLALFAGKSFVANASRSVIFASSEKDFAEKAREVLQGYNKKILSILDQHTP